MGLIYLSIANVGFLLEAFKLQIVTFPLNLLVSLVQVIVWKGQQDTQNFKEQDLRSGFHNAATFVATVSE